MPGSLASMSRISNRTVSATVTTPTDAPDLEGRIQQRSTPQQFEGPDPGPLWRHGAVYPRPDQARLFTLALDQIRGAEQAWSAGTTMVGTSAFSDELTALTPTMKKCHRNVTARAGASWRESAHLLPNLA